MSSIFKMAQAFEALNPGLYPLEFKTACQSLRNQKEWKLIQQDSSKLINRWESNYGFVFCFNQKSGMVELKGVNGKVLYLAVGKVGYFLFKNLVVSKINGKNQEKKEVIKKEKEEKKKNSTKKDILLEMYQRAQVIEKLNQGMFALGFKEACKVLNNQKEWAFMQKDKSGIIYRWVSNYGFVFSLNRKSGMIELKGVNGKVMYLAAGSVGKFLFKSFVQTKINGKRNYLDFIKS